jgi:hypothetical protein
MSVGRCPTNLRAGDAREQLTRILEPLDPEVLHDVAAVPCGDCESRLFEARVDT